MPSAALFLLLSSPQSQGLGVLWGFGMLVGCGGRKGLLLAHSWPTRNGCCMWLGLHL